jgi:hypothetical protein
MSTPSEVVSGAGIAGAGLGFALAARATVTPLEHEAQCGYHSTRCCAASCQETYGGPDIARHWRPSRPKR